MSVCLIDTSILCEILQVPGKHESHEEIYDKMARKIEEKESLLLPMSAILETGNHIGQNGDGRQRRATAEKFVEFIRQAIRGETLSRQPLSSRPSRSWNGWEISPTGQAAVQGSQT